jgi:hypothetical protein
LKAQVNMSSARPARDNVRLRRTASFRRRLAAALALSVKRCSRQWIESPRDYARRL